MIAHVDAKSTKLSLLQELSQELTNNNQKSLTNKLKINTVQLSKVFNKLLLTWRFQEYLISSP